MIKALIEFEDEADMRKKLEPLGELTIYKLTPAEDDDIDFIVQITN